MLIESRNKHRQHVTNVAREIVKRKDLLDFIRSDRPLGEIFSLPNEIDEKRVELYLNSYFGIGDTEYYKVNLSNGNKLFVKMEYTNSMGNTHYARFWLIYLYICELLGIIVPNKTNIIEVTSGSSGIALSMACEVMNYNVTILVPELLPKNRVSPMQRNGTTIIRVKGYIGECIQQLRVLINENGYFPTNHSEEKADIITSIFSRIGHEIIRDNIQPDYAFLGMGNGTSTLGIAKSLKSAFPETTICAYRPHFEVKPNDIVFGLIGANIECRHIPLAMNYIDNLEFTTGIDLSYTRNIFKYDTEINNLGFSSLYGIHYALELSREVQDATILSIGYDKIDRY